MQIFPTNGHFYPDVNIINLIIKIIIKKIKIKRHKITFVFNIKIQPAHSRDETVTERVI